MESKSKTSKIFTQPSSSSNISTSSVVKYYKFNDSDTIEATIMSKRAKPKNDWVKLNKTEMLNKETGEIKKMKANANRGINISGVKRTHIMLVKIIKQNFNYNVQTLHFVLTYSTPLYDWKKAFKDFSYFRSKLKHKYKFLEYLLRYLSLLQKEQYIYIC